MIITIMKEADDFRNVKTSTPVWRGWKRYVTSEFGSTTWWYSVLWCLYSLVSVK
jgi:hypothetical protein